MTADPPFTGPGLVINFGRMLIRDGIYRVVNRL